MINSKVHSAQPLHIALAVDGSEHALAAALLIRDLSLSPGSKVTLLAVLTPQQTPGRAALLAATDRVRGILQDRAAEVRSGLLHGQPAQELSGFANEHKSDLLVLGAKGLRATLGFLLGGVVQQVVEHARCPVLVVRAPYTGVRRVLLVTDGSSHSRRALEYLAHFPLPDDVEARVMHVLPPQQPIVPESARPAPTRPFGSEIPPSPQVYEAAEQTIAQQAEAEERAGQALLNESVEALKAAGVEATGVLARGDAATEIVEYAKTNAIDLIVAGSRGLAVVKGWLMGSVSRKLVHYAPCSVLIVREGLDAGEDSIER